MKRIYRMYNLPFSMFIVLLISSLNVESVKSNSKFDTDIDLLSPLRQKSPDSKHQKSIEEVNISQLQVNREKLKLPGRITNQVADLISSSPEFTICVQLKQQYGNQGTLLTLESKDLQRLLEIKLIGFRDRLKLIYYPEWVTSGYSRVKIRLPTLAFSKYPTWTNICLQYIQNSIDKPKPRLNLYYNCHKIVKNRALGFPFAKIRLRELMKKVNQLELWIGRRSQQKGNPFKGSFNKMIISNRTNFADIFCQDSMMVADTSKTESYQEMQKKILTLEETVEQLKKEMKLISGSLSKSHSCQCLAPCKTQYGLLKRFGDEWKENACKTCSCTLKGTACIEQKCPPLKCNTSETTIPTGQCCPRCLNTCQFRGKKYKHGERVEHHCTRCDCKDGGMSCYAIDPKKECPVLSCPYQTRPHGKCCKICQAIDWCLLFTCGENSRCQNLAHGHECVCLPGYKKDHLGHCIDINECSDPKTCPNESRCINKLGSYECECNKGYLFDKKTKVCEAFCPKCVAKSRCVSPGKCECMPGWTGDNCDKDIDECQLPGQIQCPYNSHCINLPGSYTCQCLPGYIGSASGKIAFPHCYDINECEQAKKVCPQSHTCYNTAGGFKCIPEFNSALSQSDKYQCTVVACDGKESLIKDGESHLIPDACKECSCLKGALHCKIISCNCLSGKLTAQSKKCCHGCHGDWNCPQPSYMYNPYFCKKMSCPKLACVPALQPTSLGQCCPSCPDDSLAKCNSQLASKSRSNKSASKLCITNTRVYSHGATYTLDSRSKFGDCIQCLCWDGAICCQKSFSCP